MWAWPPLWSPSALQTWTPVGIFSPQWEIITWRRECRVVGSQITGSYRPRKPTLCLITRHYRQWSRPRGRTDVKGGQKSRADSIKICKFRARVPLAPPESDDKEVRMASGWHICDSWDPVGRTGANQLTHSFQLSLNLVWSGGSTKISKLFFGRGELR